MLLAPVRIAYRVNLLECACWLHQSPTTSERVTAACHCSSEIDIGISCWLLSTHVNAQGNERPTVAKPGDVVMKRLKLWTAATSAVDNDRPLTTRVEKARATLRRVVSDSDLGNIGKSERSAKVRLQIVDTFLWCSRFPYARNIQLMALAAYLAAVAFAALFFLASAFSGRFRALCQHRCT